MIELIGEFVKDFRIVEKQSYHHENPLKTINYPYVTFDLSGERLERNIEGFYLDVDVIDSNDSYGRLLALEDDLKAHFKDNRQLLPNLYIRYTYLRSSTINTRNKLIKRRNLQFYCKVDWRNK